jgi:hypothetical protein
MLTVERGTAALPKEQLPEACLWARPTRNSRSRGSLWRQDKRKSCEVEAGRELGGRQSVSAPFVVSARLRPRR